MSFHSLKRSKKQVHGLTSRPQELWTSIRIANVFSSPGPFLALWNRGKTFQSTASAIIPPAIGDPKISRRSLLGSDIIIRRTKMTGAESREWQRAATAAFPQLWMQKTLSRTWLLVRQFDVVPLGIIDDGHFFNFSFTALGVVLYSEISRNVELYYAERTGIVAFVYTLHQVWNIFAIGQALWIYASEVWTVWA